MYVPFQKWNCYGIVPFQANLQFNSHSFDSISCQFIIPFFCEIQPRLKCKTVYRDPMNHSNSKISIPMPCYVATPRTVIDYQKICNKSLKTHFTVH